MTGRTPEEIYASRTWRLPFVVAIAVLILTGALAVRQYVRFTEASASVDHAYAVIHTLDLLIQRLVDAETAYRGYLLTGDRAFLQPHEGVQADTARLLAALRELLSTAPAPRSIPDDLSLAATAKVAEMQEVISAFEAGERTQAIGRVASGDGRRIMDEVRRIGSKVRQSEAELVEQRTSQANQAARAAQAFSAATVVATLLLSVAAFSVNRSFERRRQAFTIETVARAHAEREAARSASGLLLSEQFRESLLENTGDCVVVIDPDGAIGAMNGPGCRLMGLTPAGDWQQAGWAALWPDDGQAATAALAAAIQHGQGRFTARRSDSRGSTRWWEVIITPVRDEHAAVVRLVAIARDITAQKRADAERTELLASERAARAEAERAARMKDDFVSTLSHELRTPLNAILGWVSVLRRDQQPETLSRAIEVIDRNSRRQSQMIDDLLDVGRIVSGKLRLDVHRMELAPVVEDASLAVQPAADARGVRLVTVFGSAAMVLGDPVRLQQIAWNLLSNAIKFTPRGGRVQTTISKVNSQVVLEVVDTGVGIDAALLPHIFQRFRQADAPSASRQGGLGLGLAIVKNLVEMHGGTVEAASDGPGAGSRFTVRLPMAPAGAHRDAGDLTGPAAGAFIALLDGLEILIVEDEADAREIVDRLLSDAGATVVATRTAVEALQRLREGRVPHAILSDIGMADLDGYEFIQRVRRMGGALSSVPAVALTALARLEDRKRALMAGYHTHLAKPVDPSELIATLATLTGRTGRA